MDINIVISEDSLALDVLPASELVSVAVDPAINTSDTLTITEVSTVSFGLEVSVQTTQSPTEFNHTELNSLINVGDDLPVLEDLGYLVEDTISITESVSLSVSAPNVVTYDDVSIIEDVVLVFFWSVSVQDTLSIVESTTIEVGTEIFVAEVESISESISLVISDENVDINDVVSVVDDPSSTRMDDLMIGIGDIPGGDLNISVADAAPILDVIPFFEDTIYMWESVYMEIVPTQFGDDINLTEDVQIVNNLSINVNDQITIIDISTIPPLIIDLTVSDDVVISEYVNMTLVCLVDVFDVITISDVLTNIFSIRYSPSPENPFGDDGGLI